MDDDPDLTSVSCRTRSFRIDEPKIRRLARTICTRLGIPGLELGISLVGSAGIRRLNREFRGKDKATDVLSFPQLEWRKPLASYTAKAGRSRRSRLGAGGPPESLGDVVISLPDAERNARRIGQPLDREVCFLLVHGILHLCGHDHERPADERRMLREQRKLMTVLAGSSRSRPLWTSSVRRRAGARA